MESTNPLNPIIPAMENKRSTWTNDDLSEFAIMFESQMLTRTNEKAAYVKLVDELVDMNLHNCVWNYILSQWVVYYIPNITCHI